ncbi:hypothetical protein PL418_01505 [Barnesiella intestinihominis]|uniref:hypothetical protein n=1 Tax=Barnesiella intestinihominis TaxID=487174 RepID=UPI00189AEC25|nr:hypothetical protein [Barnesiella intestinihominis]MDB0680249.1 hypothetical protein [Barnesiella intestinihominis]
MTNTEQIRTKKISLILALSVIIFAAIATYFTLCHDINIMRITTPVILGLAMSIILCGVLQKFFYNWLTKNPIHFSFGEQSSPVIESESTTEPVCIAEIPPAEQPADFSEQEYSPYLQSSQEPVVPDCSNESHLEKYDSILEELKEKELKRQVKVMDAIREYVTIKTAPYLSKEAIATLISNIEYMACDQPELYKPIRSNIDNPLRSPGLRHLAWNVGERLRVPLAKRAVFIKASFPYELESASHEYLRLNLRDQVASQIPIDVPEKGDYRFHLETDNDES